MLAPIELLFMRLSMALFIRCFLSMSLPPEERRGLRSPLPLSPLPPCSRGSLNPTGGSGPLWAAQLVRQAALHCTHKRGQF